MHQMDGVDMIIETAVSCRGCFKEHKIEVRIPFDTPESRFIFIAKKWEEKHKGINPGCIPEKVKGKKNIEERNKKLVSLFMVRIVDAKCVHLHK